MCQRPSYIVCCIRVLYPLQKWPAPRPPMDVQCYSIIMTDMDYWSSVIFHRHNHFRFMLCSAVHKTSDALSTIVKLISYTASLPHLQWGCPSNQCHAVFSVSMMTLVQYWEWLILRSSIINLTLYSWLHLHSITVDAVFLRGLQFCELKHNCQFPFHL